MISLEPEFLIFLALLVVGGAVAGLFSGLLGIGGSIILIPLQFYLLTLIGYPPDIAMKVAIATALTFTFFTSFSSAYNHSKHKVVLWKKALLIGSFGFVFSFAGALIASHLNAVYLSVIFGTVVLVSSLKFITMKNTNVSLEKMSTKPILFAVCGCIMGLASGLTGIGGGMVLIPLLTFLIKMPLRQAIGTSAATIIFTTFGGVISYIINGINVLGLPAFSLGYVNLAMWTAMVIPGIIFAAAGAKVSHRVNEKYVRYLFSTITLLVGAGMILQGFIMHFS